MTAAHDDAITCIPVTADRWPDLAELFTRPGPRGGTPIPANCWCMWWRQRSGDAATNETRMREIVEQNAVPGLLAYAGDDPVGWVSVAPRGGYGQLARSRLYAPADDRDDVFTIACFYVDPRWKRQGITRRLLQAAVDHARACGASAVEAYPGERPDYMGAVSWFHDAGFVESRRAGKRTVVVFELDG